MTPNREIERVVFTATGERRKPEKGEWFRCEPDGSGFIQAGKGIPSSYDIYTREVFPAEPESEPAELDLREMTIASVGKIGLRNILFALIDRLDAQEIDIEGQQSIINAQADRIKLLGDRLDAQRGHTLDLYERLGGVDECLLRLGRKP